MSDDNSPTILCGIEHIRRRVRLYLDCEGERAASKLIRDLIAFATNPATDVPDGQVSVTLHDEGLVNISTDNVEVPDQLIEFLTDPAHIARHMPFFKYKLISFDVISAAAFNALCSHLILEVRRNGALWQQRFEGGRKTSELVFVRKLKLHEKNGLTISFTPDFTILEKAELDYWGIYYTLREWSFLLPNVRFTLQDKRTVSAYSGSTTFHHPDGLSSSVHHLNTQQESLHETIAVHSAVEDRHFKDRRGITQPMAVDIAFQYVSSSKTVILAYVNGQEVGASSIHVAVLVDRLKSAIQHFAGKRDLLDIEDRLDYTDITRGLTAVVSIWHLFPEERWRGILNREFANEEAGEFVSEALSAQLPEVLNESSAALKSITTHCLKNRRERLVRRFGPDYVPGTIAEYPFRY